MKYVKIYLGIYMYIYIYTQMYDDIVEKVYAGKRSVTVWLNII